MNAHNTGKIRLIVAILTLQIVVLGTTYAQGRGSAIGMCNVHFTVSAPFSIDGGDSSDTFTVNSEMGKEFTVVLVSPSYLLNVVESGSVEESTNDVMTSAAFDPANEQPLFLNGGDIYHVKFGDLVSLVQKQATGQSVHAIGLDVQCTVN